MFNPALGLSFDDLVIDLIGLNNAELNEDLEYIELRNNDIMIKVTLRELRFIVSAFHVTLLGEEPINISKGNFIKYWNATYNKRYDFLKKEEEKRKTNEKEFKELSNHFSPFYRFINEYHKYPQVNVIKNFARKYPKDLKQFINRNHLKSYIYTTDKISSATLELPNYTSKNTYKLIKILREQGLEDYLILDFLKYAYSESLKNKKMKFLENEVLKRGIKNEKDLVKLYISRFNDEYTLIENIFGLSWLMLSVLKECKYYFIEDLQDYVKTIKEEYDNERFFNSLFDDNSDLNVTLNDDLNELNLMNGYEFESYLHEFFLKSGYQVENTKLSGDQGVDLIVTINNKRIAIQAKRYSGNVNNSAVQEVMAGKKVYNCDLAIVITTGNFTKSAIELAKLNDVDLWDGNSLINRVKELNKLL